MTCGEDMASLNDEHIRWFVWKCGPAIDSGKKGCGYIGIRRVNTNSKEYQENILQSKCPKKECGRKKRINRDYTTAHKSRMDALEDFRTMAGGL
jgi:hypothetical protein